MNKTYDVMKGQQQKNITKRNYKRQYTSQEQKKIIQIYNDYDDLEKSRNEDNHIFNESSFGQRETLSK
jgi:hypothetical protein